MKKLLGGLLIALLVAGVIAAAPYWFGIQTEKVYQRRMQDLAKRGVGVTHGPYERGWLSASAQTTLEFPGVPFTFAIKHHIHHGPLPAERFARGDYTLTPELALIQSQVTLGIADLGLQLPAMQAETFIHIDGSGRSGWQFAAAKHALPNGALEWKGGNGELTFDAHWKRVQVNARFPEFSLKTAPNAVVLSRLGIEADLQEGASGRFFGTHTFNIDKFMSGDTSAEGMRFQARTRESGNQTNIALQYEVKGLTSGADSYGPGVLNIEIRKLNTAALAKMEDTLNQLQQKKMPEAQAYMMVMGKMFEAFAELAKGAPELEITRLSLKLKQGEISGKAKLVLDGANANFQENPMVLINALSGEAQVSVPAAVIETVAQRQVEQEIAALKASGKLTPEEQAKLSPEKIAQIASQLAPPRAQKLAAELRLVANGANFEATAVLKRGRLLVNNEPFTPGALGTPGTSENSGEKKPP